MSTTVAHLHALPRMASLGQRCGRAPEWIRFRVLQPIVDGCAQAGASGRGPRVGPNKSAAPEGACHESLRRQQFQREPDRDQRAPLLVKQFDAGAPLVISETPGPTTPVAAVDICMVNLLVGPGNPGPANAPST